MSADQSLKDVGDSFDEGRREELDSLSKFVDELHLKNKSVSDLFADFKRERQLIIDIVKSYLDSRRNELR